MINYRFTMNVEILDVKALRRAAYERYLQENHDPMEFNVAREVRRLCREYAAMRLTALDPIFEDLHMVLDPGNKALGDNMANSIVDTNADDDTP